MLDNGDDLVDFIADEEEDEEVLTQLTDLARVHIDEPSTPPIRNDQEFKQPPLPSPPPIPQGEPVDIVTWRADIERAVEAKSTATIDSQIHELFEDMGGAVRFDTNDGTTQLSQLCQDLFHGHIKCNSDGTLISPLDAIDADHYRPLTKALVLYAAYFRVHGIDITAKTEEHKMLNEIFRRLYRIKAIRSNITEYMSGFNANYHSSWADDSGIQLVLPENMTNATQLAVHHIVLEAERRQLRHKGKTVMRPVTLDNGRTIRAYEPYMTIEKFVYSLQRDVSSHPHQLITNVSSMKKVFDMLENTDYLMFPEHNPNPEWMAFKDGMLHLFEDGNEVWYDHDDPNIPPNTYASIYHDIDLNYHELDEFKGSWGDGDWLGIDCALHTILNLQFPSGTLRQPLTNATDLVIFVSRQ